MNADGRGEIIFRAASHSQTQADANAIGVATAAAVNGRLVAYEYDPAGDDWDVLWVSDQRYDHGPGTTTVQARSGAGVNVADFNGDGTPEAYVGNQVFNAETGVRLAAGAALDSSGCRMPDTGCFLAQTVAFDADDDGDLELAAGDVLYDVRITNASGEAGNSMPIAEEADPPSRPRVTISTGRTTPRRRGRASRRHRPLPDRPRTRWSTTRLPRCGPPSHGCA